MCVWRLQHGPRQCWAMSCCCQVEFNLICLFCLRVWAPGGDTELLSCGAQWDNQGADEGTVATSWFPALLSIGCTAWRTHEQLMRQAWECKNIYMDSTGPLCSAWLGTEDTLCFVTNLKTKLTTSPGGEASAPLGLGVSMSWNCSWLEELSPILHCKSYRCGVCDMKDCTII